MSDPVGGRKTDSGQSDTPRYGSEAVALLTAREALAVYDQLSGRDQSGNEYLKLAWQKLRAAAQEVSA
jgi:hypothetical protein